MLLSTFIQVLYLQITLLVIFSCYATLYFYSITFCKKILYFLLNYMYFTYLVTNYFNDLGYKCKIEIN